MAGYKERLKKEFWRRLLHVVFHISTAVIVMQFYSLTLKLVYWSLCIILIIIDIYRIYEGKIVNKIVRDTFGDVIRKWEFKRLAASTFTVIALSIALIFFRKEYVALAFLYQGLADPFSTFVRSYSSRLTFFGIKALEGTIGFILLVIPLTFLFSFNYPDFFTDKSFITVALVGGGAGALAEGLSVKHLDDNLSVPLAICFGLWLFYFL